MSTIGVNDISEGNIIEHNGFTWRVVSKMHVKPGKGGAFMQVELKDIRRGTKLNERFRSSESVEKVDLESSEATFLYSDGDTLEIMEDSTYEQFTVPKSILGEKIAFLTDNMPVKIQKIGDEVIDIMLPATVILTVEDVAPFIKGQTVTATYKPAKLSNGVTVAVPQFVEVGEKIVVKTETSEYVERAKQINA